MNPELEHLTFQLADVSIHAVAAGPQDGPLIILLHGYPEFWCGWRAQTQIAPLAEAGFRVAVPDQRGYNRSSKPKDWRAYKAPRLVGDVLGIAGRIDRLAILNAPHPSVFKYMRTHPAQVLRSSYMLFMQRHRRPASRLSALRTALMAISPIRIRARATPVNRGAPRPPSRA
jgi:epoxide hydrolase 4